MAFSNALVLCFFLAILNMALPSLATVYTVGDASGWVIGGDYSTWASDKTFAVGDSLGKCSSQNVMFILSFALTLNGPRRWTVIPIFSY